jgi:hypothetical protein
MNIDNSILTEIKVSIAELKRDIANLREIFEIAGTTYVKTTQCEASRQACTLRTDKLWKTIAVVVGALLLGSEGIKQLFPLLKEFL